MIDVVGFIELGGFYTSFMSGNTTQLGVGLAHMAPTLVLPAGLIAMFLIGSFLGSLRAAIGNGRGHIAVLSLVLAGLLVTLTLHANGFSSAQAMLALPLNRAHRAQTQGDEHQQDDQEALHGALAAGGWERSAAGLTLKATLVKPMRRTASNALTMSAWRVSASPLMYTGVAGS